MSHWKEAIALHPCVADHACYAFFHKDHNLMSSNIVAEFPWGWVGTLEDNELEVVSTIPDPPKVRLAVVASKVESNLGSVCFNLRRSHDPDDTAHDEMGYIMGRLTANKQQGAVYVALAPARGQSCREVLYLDPQAAVFRVPVLAPNLDATADGFVVHHGGRYATAFQADGNIVTYRRDPGTGALGSAVWASGVVEGQGQ